MEETINCGERQMLQPHLSAQGLVEWQSMVLIILITTITRMAATIMLLMISVMRKEDKEADSRRKGLLRWVVKVGRNTRSEQRIFPKLGRGVGVDSTSKGPDINLGTHSLPSMC